VALRLGLDGERRMWIGGVNSGGGGGVIFPNMEVGSSGSSMSLGAMDKCIDS